MGAFGGGGSQSSGQGGEVGFGEFAKNMLLLKNGISPSHWAEWKAQHQHPAAPVQTSTQTDPMRMFKGMQPQAQMPTQQMPQYGSPNMLGSLQRWGH